jgi:hypothetical protein
VWRSNATGIRCHGATPLTDPRPNGSRVDGLAHLIPCTDAQCGVMQTCGAAPCCLSICSISVLVCHTTLCSEEIRVKDVLTSKTRVTWSGPRQLIDQDKTQQQTMCHYRVDTSRRCCIRVDHLPTAAMCWSDRSTGTWCVQPVLQCGRSGGYL